jgi:hypothetical protein
MTEIQRVRTFPVPPGRCFEGLLRVWPAAEIQVKKVNQETRRAEGDWNLLGMTMIFHAECKVVEDGATQVIVSHDLQWTSIWSRPKVTSEKAARAFDERTYQQMDRAMDMLGKYLEDESSLPKMSPVLGLNIDHLAWIIGAVVSIGFRLLASLVASIGSSEQGSNFKLVGWLGVIFGAITAGLVKRRQPIKGNAFFDGLIVAVVNIAFSGLVYRIYFQMGWVDWVVYGLIGLICATLASLQIPRKNALA